jgi:CheY-like chemotaxis protein
VAESLLLIERLPGEGISVELELESALGPVRADPGQVSQVLMNLAVNARDAMPEGGRLSIRTENRRAGDGREWVTLAVRDAGVGMDAETQARIFEPFFTTKAPGKGTGLGLSTVYGIVQQGGGHIVVDSAPGAGTTVTVYLPRHAGAAAPAPAGAREQRLPRGTETVLLVEDEAPVRRSVCRLLRRQGYTVLEARHGADALRRFDEGAAPRSALRDAQRIDLVITDVVMPEMDGRQFVERLRARGATVPVLFMSGYDQEALRSHGEQPAGTAFLAKPFTVETLLHAVREALDGRPDSRRDGR